MMNRRENQQDDRNRDYESGNRNMGQSRDSMYRGAYRFDDHRTTRDQYGDVHDYHRDDRGQADQRNTLGQSRNYGNMGSYGGAQGFGSSRGGYGHPDQIRSGFDATSGHGQRREPEQRQVYGGYWDRNSFHDNDNDRFSRTHRPQHLERNRYNDYDQNRDRDSRYEIYDTHQRQSNQGSYNNDVRFNPTYNINRHMEDEPGQQQRYGSYTRPRHRQGDGNDMDRRYNDEFQEGNMAGSLSYGYDGYRGYPDEDRNRHYNPMSGEARRQNHDQDEDRRENKNMRRGGYDYNNQSPDERNRFR